MNEGDFIRGYRLRQEIGRGSYGDVWLAEKQMDFGGATIYYALKFLRNKSGEGVDIERVIKEIVAWTKASSHANVVSIRDSFTEHGKYVIVSDFAEGGSLKNRKFTVEEAVRVIEDVLAGIEYLHEIPIIHRDIKPENILLKNGVACISDFGLAREFDKTQSTGLGGSVNYFSPEMARKELDNESHDRTPLDDLWATAVTFYQLITGELPFKKLGHIIKCHRAPLPENFPAALNGFFNTAFHKNPARRFQSAKKMREALQKAVYTESSYENKIAELTSQFINLQARLSESQNNAHLLYKMVAEERIKAKQLGSAKEESERKSSAEKEKVQKLQDQIELLEHKLQDIQERMDETTAENLKLKKQITAPFSVKPDGNMPAYLEKSIFDAGNDFLNKKQYDQAIAHFTEVIKLNSGNATAYFKRGAAYNGRGAAYRSTEDYDNAIRDYYQATFLKGAAIKAFPFEPVYDHDGHDQPAFNGNGRLTVRDYKRALKLHPIFNDAFEKLVEAKKERRISVLKFVLKWSVLLLAFSGLYLSTYKFTRPLASDAASFLRHNLYDLGQLGETAMFVVVSASFIVLAMLSVIGLVVFLKKVLHSRVSEKAVFTAFSGVGLIFSGYIIYSVFSTNDYFQAANDCYEKKGAVCAVESYATAENQKPATNFTKKSY